MRLYHGTDLDSARRLLAGAPLDPSRATALKIDGPDGFFLATELPDAEFFALRQFRGPAAIIAYEVTSEALERLRDAGAIDRPIPRGPRSPRFLGDELFIPPEAFPAYNQLVATGDDPCRTREPSVNPMSTLDLLQIIRSHPDMYLPGGRVDPRFFATQMANDALLLGASRTIAVHQGDLWGVAADVDWLSDAPVPVAELFRRIVPLTQAGDNSMRSEVLVSAFAGDVITWSADAPLLIKGEAPNLAGIRGMLGGPWARTIVFRVEHSESPATQANVVAATHG